MPLFLDLPKLPLPATNVELFHRDAPVVLEIGFGDGSFLEWIAKTHPEWNCLGADVARGSVTRAFKRLRSANVSNVRLHHGSGLFLLRNVLSNESVSRVYVNFPDPHKQVVDLAARESGHTAHDGAYDQRCASHRHPNEQAGAGAVDHTRTDVASQVVGAEPVLGRGRLERRSRERERVGGSDD